MNKITIKSNGKVIVEKELTDEQMEAIRHNLEVLTNKKKGIEERVTKAYNAKKCSKCDMPVVVLGAHCMAKECPHCLPE